MADARNAPPKTALTDDGLAPIAVPRDHDVTSAPKLIPKLIPKRRRRPPRFDQNVLSLCARGTSVREIQEHLKELLGGGVAMTYLRGDRREVLVRNSVALVATCAGQREVLGLWIE
jgi:transposase-like protein